MAFRISFSALSVPVYDEGDGHVLLPLEKLADPGDHIHGRLDVLIDGRALPYMGFFGAQDVCFNTWVEEFRRVLAELGGPAHAVYVFDEGEQGQPAYEFRREGETLLVSVIASLVTGMDGDADYQQVACRWDEFASGLETFFADLRGFVAAASPLAGEAWWRHKMGLAG
jgi:hypothetical protein